MKKTERLNGIIYSLQERGKLSAKDLSEIFEVSMRTIYRDIDALSQLKVPILTHEGLHGGYEIDEDYFIPSIKLNEQEIIILLMILKVGEEIKLPNLSSDYELLKGKLLNILTASKQQKVKNLFEHIYFDMSGITPTTYCDDVLMTIIESFMEEKQVDIDYYHPKRHEYNSRIVSPQELFYDKGGWYLSGYCHMRLEKRVFRLDRIRRISLLDKQNKHIHQDIHSVSDKYINREYILEVEKSLFRVLKDNEYFKNYKIITDADPIVVAVTSFLEEPIRNITLSNPLDISIMSPLSFKNEIAEISKQLCKKYN